MQAPKIVKQTTKYWYHLRLAILVMKAALDLTKTLIEF